MNFLAVAGLYTLVFAFFTYVILFGDSRYHQTGCVRWTRSQMLKACSSVKLLLLRCVPKYMVDVGDNFVKYLLFTRNPCIQLFYCILVAGGTGVLTFNILSHFDSFNIYCTSAYVLITINFMFFTICSYRDPGVVTKDNVSNFLGIYEPDGLYYLEQQCNTCDIVKPARSKHCSICNVCVGRFDHHCSWVNNCIGQKNYKYFLGFIATTAVMCLYLTFVILVVFLYIVLSQGLHVSYYIDSQGNRQPASFNILAQYLLSSHTAICILFMTVVLFGLVMSGFTLFHAYLVCTNQTTNELFKRCRGLKSSQPVWRCEEKSRQTATAAKLKTSKCTKRGFQETKSVKETKQTDTRMNLTPYHRGIFRNIMEVFTL